MTRTIAIVGALDTKGPDFAFLQEEIQRRGCATLVIDVGVIGPPQFGPDVLRDEVAAAGGTPLAELVQVGDRGHAIATMAKGVAHIVQELHGSGAVHGIISMGGGAGTLIGSSAMRALPLGVPKLLVSTVASGDVAAYVGTSDIALMYSVVDVAGVNRISRPIYVNAAGAITGMVTGETADAEDKPIVAATMFGNTTRAVNHAKSILEEQGFEVLVFHATGAGGKTMEALVDQGLVHAVLDMTTTEWADEVCGGVLSAGPHRLEAAARTGTPQVVVPGCIDMCNFWARETVPAEYEGRTFYQWNPNVTLMRTTPDENRRLGEIFADKLNAATGPLVVMIPSKGFSELDVVGKPFHLPEATDAFIDAVRRHLRGAIEVVEIDTDINDPAFVDAAVGRLLAMLEQERE